MEIKCIDKNGEKLAFFTFFDPRNRSVEVLNWQKRVHEFLQIPINYIEIDYRFTNHGRAMEHIIKNLYNHIQYFGFIDSDCIFLRSDGPNIVYDKIKDGRSIFGGAQNSAHIHENHPFVAPSSFCISSKLYKELGEPILDDSLKHSDTCENVTWECQKRGYNVCLVYPTSYKPISKEDQEKTGNPEYWKLGFDSIKYGMSTTYGDIWFHGMVQNIEQSRNNFIQKCQQIIGEKDFWLKDVLDQSEKNIEKYPEWLKNDKKIECVICCKNYADYLELTLPENSKYFDNIIIVTDPEDYETQIVVKSNGKYANNEKINFVTYNDWKKNGAVFNKGGALNFGLQHLKYNDWVVIMDSDIVIKEKFKEKLNDKTKFYGSYRRFIPSLNDYKLLTFNNPNGIFTNNYKEIEGSGCGFFQCLHFNALKQHQDIRGWMYPDSYSAEQVDIDFLRQFCPFINNEYHGLVRMGIELWHLGNQPGLNNNGRSEKDNFFNA